MSEKGNDITKRIHIVEPSEEDLKVRKLRELTLERDGHKCFVCGSTKNIDAYHDYNIFGVFFGDTPENEIHTLCGNCHEAVKCESEEMKEILLRIRKSIETGTTAGGDTERSPRVSLEGI